MTKFKVFLEVKRKMNNISNLTCQKIHQNSEKKGIELVWKKEEEEGGGTEQRRMIREKRERWGIHVSLPQTVKTVRAIWIN